MSEDELEESDVVQVSSPTSKSEESYDDNDFEPLSPETQPKKWYDEEEEASSEEGDEEELDAMVIEHQSKSIEIDSKPNLVLPKKKSSNSTFQMAFKRAKNLSPFRTKKQPSSEPSSPQFIQHQEITTGSINITSTRGSSPRLPSFHGHSGGANPGHVGSGVLLEGWLRQKQRKGVKGMKHWNERYFVLYSKVNEIRYYSDVTAAAWGPIPISEIGSIPLRLIQRISTPSHPKYKGCRFDITCRSSYSSQEVSSDEEQEETNQGSRVYSLLADSPQTRVSWVNMLDSLLKRSASTPTSADLNEVVNRRKSKRVVEETAAEIVRIVESSDQIVPMAVKLAIEYLESSTPGIEMKRFYQVESNASRIKISLQFLNEFALRPELNSPQLVEMEQYLDPVTAGAIIKQWISNSEQPIIPFQLFDDFIAVADYAEHDPYDVVRNLKGLVTALPEKNLHQLECIVMHLAGVAEYAKENKLSATELGLVFGNLLLRPRSDGETTKEESEDSATVVQHLIANAESVF